MDNHGETSNLRAFFRNVYTWLRSWPWLVFFFFFFEILLGCQFCTFLFWTVSSAVPRRSSQARPDCMWTVCELRASGFSADFPFQFPGFGWATEGQSESCPEATRFGWVLWVAAMLKGELLAVCKFDFMQWSLFFFFGPSRIELRSRFS